MTAQDRRGQLKVIAHVRGLVDAWRGFPLGAAGDPSPVEPPRYEPIAEGDQAITATTRALLTHWFRREPHLLGASAWAFKYWPHQRRAVETFIYLYEVRRIRRTEGLFALAEEEALQSQHDPWAKLGGQLATGSGKTKVMSLIVAWAYLNATQEPETDVGFGRHALLIAPGLFVRDRLLADFLPSDGRPSIFWSDPVLPPELERSWDLKVYSPDTCPLHLDPREGALLVTNYQQLLRTRDEVPDLSQLSPEDRQLELLFAAGDPERLEAVASPLIERFARSRGLLVINDEAHRVWDEPGHAWFEKKAREKAKISAEEVNTQMGWIRCLRRLHGSSHQGGRLALQIDLSATLFQETGSLRKVGDTATLRDQELFRHTAVRYELSEAIRDGIVKKPILERVVVRDKQTGEPQPLIRPGQPNAWETFKNLLTAGIERWKKVRDQLIDEGDLRKPILFLLCNDRNEALEIANALRFGDPRREDLSSEVPTGWPDPQTGEPLFIETGADGVVRSTVIEIHIGKKEESNEEEWTKIRAAVNAIDHDEIADPDPNAPRDEYGHPRKIPNPYNVVVSVMMLREGWDVRNVKVIVPTRPCDSRTLTEQALGRGLRKMHAPELDEDGGALLLSEELYVMEHPSFRAIIEDIDDLVEQKDSDEIDAVREYVPIEPKEDAEARERVDVRLVNYEGMQEVRRQWYEAFSLARALPLGPRVAWKEELGESEIQTFLQKALEKEEAEGQLFTLPSDPSYRDFAHVLDHAYVIPLLKELRASFQHKVAVRAIVQSYLEQKTFAVPAGLPIALDRVIEAGNARLVIGNLARPEIIAPVKKALLPALREAFTAERPSEQAVLSQQIASHLGRYQAIKKCVLNAPVKSVFKRAAMDSAEEERVAVMLDGAEDVTGWIYNHRAGVGYAIPYEFRGLTGRYFPDFVARAKLGEVMHNFIIEVKGRLDDRDKAKAERGRQYCDLLTTHDVEPWHYLMIIENPQSGRADVSWWEQQSVREVGHLLRRHEALPLFPDGETTPAREVLKVLPKVAEEREYRDALPVFDLEARAGGFSETHSPEPIGWVEVKSARALDRRMFVARVHGASMEPGVPDGCWAVFRAFPAGSAPSASSLDGRRVAVQLRQDSDPETGGQYTLKRWRVGKVDADGGAEVVELRPDNPSFKVRKFSAGSEDIRVVAELVEVLA